MVGKLKDFCKAVGPDKNKKITLIGWTDFKKKVPARNYGLIFFSKNLGWGSENNRFFPIIPYIRVGNRV